MLRLFAQTRRTGWWAHFGQSTRTHSLTHLLFLTLLLVLTFVFCGPDEQVVEEFTRIQKLAEETKVDEVEVACEKLLKHPNVEAVRVCETCVRSAVGVYACLLAYVRACVCVCVCARARVCVCVSTETMRWQYRRIQCGGAQAGTFMFVASFGCN